MRARPPFLHSYKMGIDATRLQPLTNAGAPGRLTIRIGKKQDEIDPPPTIRELTPYERGLSRPTRQEHLLTNFLANGSAGHSFVTSLARVAPRKGRRQLFAAALPMRREAAQGFRAL
jgi:hypothetical protein